MPIDSRDPERRDDIIVLIPIFNDWEALATLLEALDASLAGNPARIRVLVVDDASTCQPSVTPEALRNIAEVLRLPLRRNLGHQRAIAIGLAYIEQSLPCDAVVVMDGDGEDAPADVPRLMQASRADQGVHVIFAERMRRAEGRLFRALYLMFRAIHRVLTGRGVRVGNFSIVPRTALHRLVVVSELWNHYAAAVFRSRIPYLTVPTQRSPRLAGQSHMSFVSLVTHGLSAMSVHGDIIGVRLLVANALCWGAMGFTLLSVLTIRFFSVLAIPGWASSISMLLIVLMSQSAVLTLVFVFVTLQGRAGHGFLPIRDYVHYVDPIEPWLTRPRPNATSMTGA